MYREEWLDKATDLLRPYFKERGYEIPELVRLSCGFPNHSPRTTQGQCFRGTESVDGVKQIYISPFIGDSIKVLDVLTHELIHAALPDGVAHKKPFKQACAKLGLEGPAKSAYAGSELLVFLQSLVNEEKYFLNSKFDPENCLPNYPHSKLSLKETEKKQTARMHKLVCRANDDHPETDIVVRASKKVTALGIPLCFCGKEFLIEEKENEE